jgi:hypothetical protein
MMPTRGVGTVSDENDVLVLEKVDKVLDHHDMVRQQRAINTVCNNIANVVGSNRKVFHTETSSDVML